VRLIDISMEIHPEMLVYPGNPAPQIEQYAEADEDGMNESKFTLGSHTGTHVDSRLHLEDGGRSVAALPLDAFYGDCVLLDVTQAGKEIGVAPLRDSDIPRGSIVLLKTENSLKGYEEFREDYAHLTVEAARYLVDLEVRTLGVDYLSVEPFDEGDEVHDILVGSMVVFEGLDLRDVPAGRYLFAGLPLRIDADGAPARAILVAEQLIGEDRSPGDA
jgi:arylformamidase